MKKILSTIALICFTFTALQAQIYSVHDSVTTSTTTFEGQDRTCLTFRVKTDEKSLEKSWSKYLRKNHDVKLSGRDLLAAEGVQVYPISERRLDFYTQINQDEKEWVEMKVFARFGYDVFVQPQNDANSFDRMRGLLDDFLGEYLPMVYEENIDAQIEAIEELAQSKEEKREAITDLKEDINDNSNEIADLEAENSEMESEIDELTQDAEALKSLQYVEEMELKALKEDLSEITE